MDTKTGKPVTKGGTAKNDTAFKAVMKKLGKRMGANQPKKLEVLRILMKLVLQSKK